MGTLPNNERDVQIVDHLETPVEILQTLRRHCRFLVSFDDTGPGHYEADLAINSLYRCSVVRPSHSTTDSRQGFEYALIDSCFYPRGATRRPARHLLLSQGGADTFGMLPKLVRAASLALSPWPNAVLHVHVGPAFRFCAELDLTLAEVRHQVQLHRDTRDMADLMAGMDAAVAGGGIMALELTAMGIPTLLITAEAREIETMTELGRVGAARPLGFGNEGLAALPEALRMLWHDDRLRSELGAQAVRVIDNKGLDRIIELILAQLERIKIHTNPGKKPVY
jgi:spore coat polysaccharide biosynthesis predicted glycosyltransferase SpsG